MPTACKSNAHRNAFHRWPTVLLMHLHCAKVWHNMPLKNVLSQGTFAATALATVPSTEPNCDACQSLLLVLSGFRLLLSLGGAGLCIPLVALSLLLLADVSGMCRPELRTSGVNNLTQLMALSQYMQPALRSAPYFQ